MAVCTPRRGLSAGLLVAALVLLWHNSRDSLTASSFAAPFPGILSCSSSSVSLQLPGASYNVSYTVFEPTSDRSSGQQVQQADSLPASCLDAFIAHGLRCIDARPVRLDALWTYVNGSDPLHQNSYTRRFKDYYSSGPHQNLRAQPMPKLFRDHDELRHSMRSVLRHFRPHLSRVHLVTADLPPPSNVNETVECASSTSRLGQIPQWLMLGTLDTADGSVSFSLRHHSQFFTQYSDTVFNSFAIESQISNVANLEEHFLYMNDDYFLTSDVNAADFYTRHYGIVLRLQSDAVVIPASQSKSSGRGEWFALEHSNEILSRRFGYRTRPYLVHQVKTGSRSLMQEMRLAFPDEMLAASQNIFRDEPSASAPLPIGKRDLHPMWMFANFVVERWREALLWTWVVAKLGEDDDTWGPRAINELASLGWTGSADVVVVSGKRGTLSPDQIALHLGQEFLPRRTTYEFASLDGYPFHVLGRHGVSRWPNLTVVNEEIIAQDPAFSCRINAERCFPPSLKHASDVFKHVSFEDVQCGDCIIIALVARSGELGLSAFLPAEHRHIAGTPHETEASVPHLPLQSDWRKNDYSLRRVLSSQRGDTSTPGSNLELRDWTVRLLHRYQWVIGSTPSHFQSLSSPKQARSALEKVKADIKNDEYAMLCLNDNIAMRPEETSQVFRDWQEGMWGERMVWERDTT
ncbi:hypothetical protein EXIGLDRAFT_767013 [Exidia glandulosa HHB12029]|uniref:Stealth protein CR2 conserved region 2 domain-containing protein n=1 Tax=Exidia glandulosa HHB12029 TaxID=1314781 RepID=A0A165JB90_EXIGL|nr:hypothetical protein EXIGLDRAFT_767013 [Exidia glandulosa HHB12029]